MQSRMSGGAGAAPPLAPMLLPENLNFQPSNFLCVKIYLTGSMMGQRVERERERVHASKLRLTPQCPQQPGHGQAGGIPCRSPWVGGITCRELVSVHRGRIQAGPRTQGVAAPALPHGHYFC